MAEILYEAILGKLIEYLVKPLKDQVSYLCCYSCNVPRLADEVGELNVRYESVQEHVRPARNNLEIITPVVDSWLKKVEEVQRENDRIRDAAEEVRRSCLGKWFPVLHYSLSRDAAKTTEDAIILREEILPDRISNPRMPAELDPIPATSEIRIKSRDFMEDQIMNALRDESVYLIGLCGMGGIGKTTMAKQIEKKVRDAKSMFEHVVMAIVSQQLDKSEIQKQIAEGLCLQLSEKSLIYRARELHQRLMEEKSILIILDDVWERLNLEELGIPSQRAHVRCKVLLTSRNERAFTLTDNPVSRIFRLEVLNDKESWIIFRENVGSAVDSPNLIQMAKDIARECKGLPLALKTVGGALRDRDNSSWEDALVELRKSMPMNVEGVVKDVYQPLMFSIKQLESEEARCLFLLCCLFPEDYDISLKELVRCGMGLGIFEGLDNLMVARNRVQTVLKNLISRSLLMEKSDYWGILCVKMHDVIRDVGIWIASEKKIQCEGKIASKEKHVFMVSHGKEEWPRIEDESYGNYTGISLQFSSHDVVIPEILEWPRLEVLLMKLISTSRTTNSPNIPENFFGGMRRLRVLEAYAFGSLPSSFGQINNLRTLHLCGCMFKTVSVIGKLINLEILSLQHCVIDKLPIEIGGLKKLRQLDISYCSDLRIAFGVISGLVQLEELVMSDSLNWGTEANGSTNARLAELDCLKHLTTLHIGIRNPSAIPTQMPPWVQKVKKYNINVSNLGKRLPRFHKVIILWEIVENWVYDMARDAEYLDIRGSSCPLVVKRLAHCSSRQNCLKYLGLFSFTGVQYLAGAQENDAIFPMLETLQIYRSQSLQEISNGPLPAGSFESLEEINLSDLSGLTCLWKSPAKNFSLSNLIRVWLSSCHNLTHLFSLSIAQSLPRLELLKVSNCESMEEIFKEEHGEMEMNKIEFPKLNSLCLQYMKNLRCLCKMVDGIDAPALHRLELLSLHSIVGMGDLDINHQCLFEQQFAGSFSGLRILRVERIYKLRFLFSNSILEGFSNLEKLEVIDCSELEEVIRKDGNVGETIISFPKLERLLLSNLPNILTFCYTGVELPLLQELYITRCPLMEKFSQVLHDTSNLRFSLPFFNEEVYYPKLNSLGLSYLHNIARIFSSPTFRALTNLEGLSIRECKELREVVAKEEVENSTNSKDILSLQLKELELQRLPKVHRFCHMKHSLEFPSLETVRFDDCPMLERFSLGPLYLPSATCIHGLPNAEFAAKFLFNKEFMKISSCQFHSENNCFTAPMRDINLRFCQHYPGNFRWFLELDLSGGFVDVLELPPVSLVGILENFETTKLLAGVPYEIVGMIRLDKNAHARVKEIEIELTLPGGMTQKRVEIMNELPIGKWIEIFLGKFIREPHQCGQLKFALRPYLNNLGDTGLFMKGVRIMKA